MEDVDDGFGEVPKPRFDLMSVSNYSLIYTRARTLKLSFALSEVANGLLGQKKFVIGEWIPFVHGNPLR